MLYLNININEQWKILIKFHSSNKQRDITKKKKKKEELIND